MKWLNSLKIKNWGISASIIAGQLDVKTTGIASRISGTSLHVLLMDYDATTDEILEVEAKWLQQSYELGNFVVLKTSNVGRHVICLDVLRASQVYDILNTSTCDQMFQKAPIMNPKNSWVLRCGTKGNRGAPTYAYTIKSKYEGKNLQSLGHANYLMNFGIKIRLKQPFGPNEVELQKYFTKKKEV